MKDQIGVITSARIEAGNLLIDVQLSDRPDVQPIADDLAAGILRNVSVGYVVHASQQTKDGDGKLTITRTDWEPYEVSLVTIPADGNAHIRSHSGDFQWIRFSKTHPLCPPPPSSGDELIARAERERISEIRTIGGRLRVPLAEIESAINTGLALDDFRGRALDHAAAEASKIRIFPVSGGEGDDINPIEAALGGALVARMKGTAPEGASREWMGRHLLDLGAALCESRGERVSWRNRDRLATQIMTPSGGHFVTRSGAHSTSDFPTLVAHSGNRVLQDAYNAAETPLKLLSRRRYASDFRSLTKVKLSESPRLRKVSEGGEVKYGSRSEAKESFKIETYAGLMSFTRQMLINDDLEAFADMLGSFGRAAAETEADLLVSLFTANSGDGVGLDDGSPIYSTGRLNKAGTGTALTIASLGAARRAMREMKGLDGVTPIGVTPKHLVVSPAKETEAEQALAAIAAAQIGDANPFTGKITFHVEPRFTGNAWRLFADPAELPTIEIADLDGREGPSLDSQDGWDTLGAEFRAVLDFGCGITEYRGTYPNSGA